MWSRGELVVFDVALWFDSTRGDCRTDRVIKRTHAQPSAVVAAAAATADRERCAHAKWGEVYADALRIDGRGRFVGGGSDEVYGCEAALRHEVECGPSQPVAHAAVAHGSHGAWKCGT